MVSRDQLQEAIAQFTDQRNDRQRQVRGRTLRPARVSGWATSFTGTGEGRAELRYATPAPEFAVSVFDIDGAALGGEIDAPCRNDGPQILVCTAGAVTVRSKTQTLELARGAAAWVAADGGPLRLRADEPAQLFRATVGI